jgi:hypothetical protein
MLLLKSVLNSALAPAGGVCGGRRAGVAEVGVAGVTGVTGVEAAAVVG